MWEFISLIQFKMVFIPKRELDLSIAIWMGLYEIRCQKMNMRQTIQTNDEPKLKKKQFFFYSLNFLKVCVFVCGDRWNLKRQEKKYGHIWHLNTIPIFHTRHWRYKFNHKHSFKDLKSIWAGTQVNSSNSSNCIIKINI